MFKGNYNTTYNVSPPHDPIGACWGHETLISLWNSDRSTDGRGPVSLVFWSFFFFDRLRYTRRDFRESIWISKKIRPDVIQKEHPPKTKSQNLIFDLEEIRPNFHRVDPP